MKLKFKRLDKSISLPKYATEGSVGFDICAAKTIEVPPGAVGIIPTGLAVQVPEGTELTIRPRSGISTKTPLRVILGTVDSDYFQELGIIVENNSSYVSGFGGNGSYTIEKGQRIAQGVLSPVIKAEIEEVDELPNSKHTGFGSTGIVKGED
jgi:dUTP pyrophosphatase